MHIFKAAAAATTASILTLGAASAATVDLTASETTVTVGETVQLNLAVSAEAAESVTGTEFDILFDDSVFSFEGVTFDGLDVEGVEGTTDIGLTTDVFDAPGGLTVFGLTGDELASLDANQADDFVLATLTFTAEEIGESTFSLMSLQLFSDIFGSELLAAELLNDMVTVTVEGDVVPLPAAAVFLLTGLSGLALRRRVA